MHDIERFRWAGVLSVLVTTGAFAQAQPSVTIVPRTPAAATTFGQLEWRVDLGRIYDNPFDPDQIAVDATFTGPDGSTRTTPAFWNKTADAPDGTFFVRFAPPLPGRWSFSVAAADAGGRRVSESQEFHVLPSEDAGFVRIAENRRYFRFDNGKSYFPIGLNLAWPPAKERAEWYDQIFAKLADNGGNFARIWMAHPPAMLESLATGPRRYNLLNADYYDRILASARKHGIRVMLCFMNHRELLDHDMWGPGGWDASIFNAKNGGPATQPFDFFTHDAAARQFKARLRYIVARYAAFTSVGFWELFNEQEGTLMKIPVAWDTDMAAYLRSIDPYQHPVTTSSIVPDPVWQSLDIALTQSHLYGNGTTVDLVSPVPRIQAEHEKFAKPHLFAEVGIDFHGGDYSFDRAGKATAFHNALWSAALSGSAGTGMYWWWDNYIDPKNLWHEFKPIADFARRIDWAHAQFKPLRITEVHRKTADVPFVDLTLPTAGGWGVVAKTPILVPLNGLLDRPLPRFLCGPGHKEQYQPITLMLDLPQPSQLILSVNRVSDFAVLRVFVDGKPFADLPFSALPGTAGTSSSGIDKESGFYRAELKQPATLLSALPAGKHQIKLDLIAGDWITLKDVTFSQALDGRYANLTTIAVQDAVSHETLAWLYDTRSNWKLDQIQNPQPQTGVRVTIPNIDHGAFTVEWWDTRRGAIVRTDAVSASDGKLILEAPPFTRDIALCLRPAPR